MVAVGGRRAYASLPPCRCYLREDLQLGRANARPVHVEAGERGLVAVGRVAGIVVLVALVRRPARALVRAARRSRTWVAFVCGTSNERMISSGARGRGATAGNASAGLVKIA